jgi:hypothetical protein
MAMPSLVELTRGALLCTFNTDYACAAELSAVTGSQSMNQRRDCIPPPRLNWISRSVVASSLSLMTLPCFTRRGLLQL